MGKHKAEDIIAGNSKALEALRKLVIYPILYAKEARRRAIKWPKGLLLFGPPGTGKTSLVHAVAEEYDAHLTMINPYFVLKVSGGESEKYLREAFSEAYSSASYGKPSIIFIDDIDAICPPRNDRKGHESRIVNQLRSLMDGSKTTSKALPHIVVVASTNRVDAIDPTFRRPGRFDLEIEVTVPTQEERFQILKLHSKNLCMDDDVDLQDIVSSTNGYVGADLQFLCSEASRLAYRRMLKTGIYDNTIKLKMDDWENALSMQRPSITKGVTKEIAKVTWDDIGGLKDIKEKLKEAVEWPIKYADAFARLGISPVSGVLLHGLPGCSKTTLAKAAVHAAQASFFSLSGAELYSKHVGEGEAFLRKIFEKARLAAPSIIFFDDADAIAPKRGDGGDSSGNDAVGERLLSTLLTEMDGLEPTTGIIVLGATNRPEAIDPALMRPGRFDLVLHVPPPDIEGRFEILRIKTRKMRLGEDLDLMQVALCTDLCTGADLGYLCTKADRLASRENTKAECVSVYARHFQAVINNGLRSSLTKSQIEEYDKYTAKFNGCVRQIPLKSVCSSVESTGNSSNYANMVARVQRLAEGGEFDVAEGILFVTEPDKKEVFNVLTDDIAKSWLISGLAAQRHAMEYQSFLIKQSGASK